MAHRWLSENATEEGWSVRRMLATAGQYPRQLLFPILMGIVAFSSAAYGVSPSVKDLLVALLFVVGGLGVLTSNLLLLGYPHWRSSAALGISYASIALIMALLLLQASGV